MYCASRRSTFHLFFYIVYRVLRITDHDALRNTGRRRVKLDDPAHKSEIVEEAVQRVQWVGDITGRPMSTNHPDTGIVDLILDMDSIEILPAPVSRHLARGDFGILVILHGLQHPEHNPYLVITQTAALPQSLAVTTRDTCLCQLSVPSPHVTPLTRGRAELTLT